MADITLKRMADGGLYNPSLSGVKPGDTILLDGDYPYIKIDGLKGTAAAPIVFKANKPIRVGYDNNSYACQIINSEHWIFEGTGITVGNQDSNPYSSSGFNVYWSQNYVIRNTTIQHVQAGIYNADASRAYTNILIENNTFRDINNPSEGGRSEGIYLGNSSTTNITTGVFTNVTIRGNKFDNLAGDAIQAACSQNLLIEGNAITNGGKASLSGQQCGIQLGGNSNGVIRNNSVENYTGPGICVFGFGVITVEGNRLTNTATGSNQDALYIRKTGIGGDKLTVNISGNTIDGASRYGINNANNSATGLGGTWKGNVVTGAKVGKYLTYIGDKIDETTTPVTTPVTIKSVTITYSDGTIKVL